MGKGMNEDIIHRAGVILRLQYCILYPILLQFNIVSKQSVGTMYLSNPEQIGRCLY